MDIKYIQHQQFPQLCYRVTGSGPALVLVHGFPQSGVLWSQVWDELSGNFRVIVPDLPGVGGSAYVTGLSMEDMATALQAILEAEKVYEAVIAGHSMGGYAALAFAELFPASVKGLVMVHSLATADSEEKKETRRKSIALIQKGGKEAFIRQMMPGLFSKAFKEQHQEVLEMQVGQGSTVEADSLAAFYNAMINRPDRTKVLSGADFPVQWILGREDSIASPQHVLQQTRLSSVNFVSVYDDCAHMAMLEQPVELIKDLTYFSKYCYKS